MKKVYIITGAGHFPGIGSCTAEHLVKTGNCVVVNSRSFDDRWTELVSEYPDSIALVAGDISEETVQDKLIATAIDTWGQLDCLVNNAASLTLSGAPTREIWSAEFLMNVAVPYELSMKAAQYLRLTKGNIVMIGSRAGLQTVVTKKNYDNLAYSASKCAMHQLTRSLSVMLAPEIRVNAVAPGLFPTARYRKKYAGKDVALEQLFVDSSLLEDVISAQGLVDGIVFLSNNPHMTGHVLPVCNGADVHKAYISRP